jgi:hypothetical protein
MLAVSSSVHPCEWSVLSDSALNVPSGSVVSGAIDRGGTHCTFASRRAVANTTAVVAAEGVDLGATTLSTYQAASTR